VEGYKMAGTAQNVGGYKQISATGNVSPFGASLLGIFVSSSSSGTITIYDSATTTTTWYPMPVGTTAGIYVVVGGTLSATVVFA
jgi:hypothetical protein